MGFKLLYIGTPANNTCLQASPAAQQQRGLTPNFLIIFEKFRTLIFFGRSSYSERFRNRNLLRSAFLALEKGRQGPRVGRKLLLPYSLYANLEFVCLMSLSHLDILFCNSGSEIFHESYEAAPGLDVYYTMLFHTHGSSHERRIKPRRFSQSKVDSITERGLASQQSGSTERLGNLLVACRFGEAPRQPWGLPPCAS